MKERHKLSKKTRKREKKARKLAKRTLFTTQAQKEAIISAALSPSGNALAAAMCEPIKVSLAYQGIGRKILMVDSLPGTPDSPFWEMIHRVSKNRTSALSRAQDMSNYRDYGWRPIDA